MNKIRFFALLFLGGAVAFLLGCQKSGLPLFSPTSDIHVVNVAPNPLNPAYVEDGGSIKFTVEQVKFEFNINNGISVFLNNYSMKYYSSNGQPILSGKFDYSGALDILIQAPDVTMAGGATTASGTTTASGSHSVGDISLEVMPSSLFFYMTNNTLSQADDVTPVIARILISGKDVNNNDISISTQVTLSTRQKN
ncbi:MAG: hypothetical protein HQM09_17415 [Candidatus Riflebacteria bacterium]|nr:hypothetical protein [Candidatus Riflebacteria bacterium]